MKSRYVFMGSLCSLFSLSLTLTGQTTVQEPITIQAEARTSYLEPTADKPLNIGVLGNFLRPSPYSTIRQQQTFSLGNNSLVALADEPNALPSNKFETEAKSQIQVTQNASARAPSPTASDKASLPPQFEYNATQQDFTSAQQHETAPIACRKRTISQLQFSQGYRRDRLNWSIRGQHGHPTVLSELHWKDMDIWVSRLAGKIQHGSYYSQASLAYGVIFHGTVSDVDYYRDGRKGLFQKSRHEITGDYTFDAVLKFGRDFHIHNDWTIAPEIGYGAYIQKLRMKHGRIEVAANPHSGHNEHHLHRRVHGLNTRYKAKWYSPQFGFSTTKNWLYGNHIVDLTGSYAFLYPLKYKSVATWNLRHRDQRHFTQTAKSMKSFGHVISLESKYAFNEQWSLGVGYQLMLFYAKKGHDYMGDIGTKFRAANYVSNEVRLNLTYEW